MSYPGPGMRFEETGEERRPRRGDWYRGLRGPAMAERDFDVRSLPILRRVDDGARSAEEIERERLDAEGKAREAEGHEDFKRQQQVEWNPPAPPRVPEARPNDLRPVNETARDVARTYRLPYGNDPED